MEEITEIFARHGLRPVAQRKVRKIPRFMMHLPLCRLKLRFLRPVIQMFEQLPFGSVTIILWQKQGDKVV
jgi:hypothetical protein